MMCGVIGKRYNDWPEYHRMVGRFLALYEQSLPVEYTLSNDQIIKGKYLLICRRVVHPSLKLTFSTRRAFAYFTCSYSPSSMSSTCVFVHRPLKICEVTILFIKTSVSSVPNPTPAKEWIVEPWTFNPAIPVVAVTATGLLESWRNLRIISRNNTDFPVPFTSDENVFIFPEVMTMDGKKLACRPSKK